ncbi:sugar ABC transporter permease [Spirochaetales bacterium NM-380-WT-3C1]|uniref:Sugar ABC transporter permease n=1 Tax=Bullifex porci TaxID=2606638 RepID=A0A7X2TR64_9SPIO|nr:sugar ABC transporter permease [Bullifex porci]MSU05840.1 sugar ABC transporter permease [Bullifex porci]
MSENVNTSLIKRKKISFVPYWFILPAVILLIVLMLYPIITVIYYSFMDKVITVKESHFVGFKNYKTILADPVFWISVKNTLVYTIISVFFHMIIGLAFALLLNTDLIPSFLKGLLRVCFIMPWVLTVTIVAILWRLILNPDGILNYILSNMGLMSTKIAWLSEVKTAMPSLIFINIWSGYPYFMVTILAALQGIPKDYYEAATIDGCNGFEKFIYITLPQLKPVMLSIIMLDLIWTMRVFALVWSTTGGGPITATEVLGSYIYKKAYNILDFSTASAASVIILLMSIVLSIFYVKAQKVRED